MASDPKVPEAMEWRSEETPEGEGQDELSQDTAPSVETDSTRLARSHSGGPAPRSPSFGIGFLVKQRSRRKRGSKSPAHTRDSAMTGRIERLDRILGCFDPTLKESRDARHLSFNSLPAEVLTMAHELLKFKAQLRAGAQIVGQELNQMDEQVRILDQESQKVQESFASTVAERLGETDDRQARHEAVTSQLDKTVQGTEAQSIHRDLLLDQEIVRLNEQHKRELENHEISLNLMKQEMLEHRLAEQARDGEISELKAMVQTLMGQVKGKGKVSDPTPEASGAGGGKPPPPRHGAAGAPGGGGGGDPDDEGEGSGRKPDENRKGRRDERPAPQPEENDYDAENDELFNLFSRVMANALGQRTRVPAEPPAMFRNEKHQDIRMWLMTCTDYFGRNSWQWEDEAQRIRYAISRMDGKDVAPFALTYRRQMTAEIGYTRQEGYEFWHVFAEQVLRPFGPTHEAEKSLREMGSVKYRGDVAKFLMEMENLNIHARVTGIAWRKMIEDELPKEALRRLSHREYVDDGEWLDAVRTVTRVEEHFKERKDLRGGGPSGTTRGEKRKFEDSKPTVAAKRVKKQYTAMEKAAYQKKKAGERQVKKEGWVAPKGEVRHTVWSEAHQGVDQKDVDKRKSNNECTRCGMKNHTWKYCRKPIQVSTIYRGQSKPKRQSAFAPKRRPQIATVAVDGQGESPRRAVQRPPAWAFEDDDIL